MSNNKMNTPPTIRWQLLSTVSALALLSSAYTAQAADADNDNPALWIELGGQLEHVTGQGQKFPIGFLTKYPDSSVLQNVTPLQAQNPSPFAFGGEGKISYQPESSDWVFSAAVRYGRSSNNRHVDHQTNRTVTTQFLTGSGTPYTFISTAAKFADTHAQHHERHAVLDFSAGKDVGLGLFGMQGSSVLSAGIRFAQFTSNASFDIRARPDLQVKYFPSVHATRRLPLPYYHTYHLSGDASRSFSGMGPSISWSGSTPFAGNLQSGELIFDWGANAALLFGRQKANVRDHGIAHYHSALALFFGTPGILPVVYQQSGGHSDRRSVTVPNVGGSVGLSWRVEDFKVSMGYRADFFFGAMDTGIDAVKKSDLAFKGPFASISVGLGD